MSAIKGKKIKNIIIVIGVLIAVVLVFAGIWISGETQKVEEDAQGQRNSRMSFVMGETMHLDAEEDVRTANLSADSFEAGFPWSKGTMDAVINDAALYDDPEAAGLSSEEITFKSALGKPFLLVKATLENVNASIEPSQDANSLDETFDEFSNLYNLGFLGIHGGELCYFNGTSLKADEAGKFDFEIEQGQQKQFTFGFCMHDEESFNNMLNVGINPGKYQVKLDVDDKRTAF